jgi:hypothetical protein
MSQLVGVDRFGCADSRKILERRCKCCWLARVDRLNHAASDRLETR